MRNKRGPFQKVKEFRFKTYTEAAEKAPELLAAFSANKKAENSKLRIRRHGSQRTSRGEYFSVCLYSLPSTKEIKTSSEEQKGLNKHQSQHRRDRKAQHRKRKKDAFIPKN